MLKTLYDEIAQGQVSLKSEICLELSIELSDRIRSWHSPLHIDPYLSFGNGSEFRSEERFQNLIESQHAKGKASRIEDHSHGLVVAAKLLKNLQKRGFFGDKPGGLGKI